MNKALIIYIGNGYSEFTYSYDKTYAYSVDMRENFLNHQEKIFKNLSRKGYELDFALLTNKHEKYQDFLDFYNAIHLDYDDLNDYDLERLKEFYYWKTDIPTGNFYAGGRFFKIRNQIPHYELYVIIRADVSFKMGLNELNVDYTKMNWLWPETDYSVFCDELREDYLKARGSDCWCWESYHRVNGNILNIVPNKYFNLYKSYIWMEHTAFTYMMRDLYPIITLNDINMMLGWEKCYVTDLRFTENPVYTLNKKILESHGNVQTHRFGSVN